MKYLFFLLLLGCTLGVAAQESDTGYVTVHADPRLALVVNKPANTNRPFIGKVRGFRVQIYNGNDRKKASQVKLDFMRSFPGIRSYLVYNNPQFRVRVGDFRGRKDALELYNKLSAQFNPSMVVPDVINVNTVRKNKESSEDDD
ncbi:SPOR domain-containing protein [Taibaiella koreensis]|uniref:SPOR domain-containing protein n=1 Tax=Taibaiella koreensis TaxID=1268548 RepID=UPI000E59ECF6|nr:SPOR domain-containing protein [Taibaiella koreensis]